MVALLYIAASDLNVLIGIVAAVIWVIAQLVSRGSQKRPPAPPPPGGTMPGEPVNPQDELRRFLATLTGETSETAPKEPTPPPKPERPPPARRFPQQPTLAAQPRKIPRRPTPTPPPRPAPMYQPIVQPVYAPPPVTAARGTPLPLVTPIVAESEARRELVSQFRKNMSLRQFVVASEVLGAPLALRPAPRNTPYV